VRGGQDSGPRGKSDKEEDKSGWGILRRMRRGRGRRGHRVGNIYEFEGIGT
jgi:hypothetical protein